MVAIQGAKPAQVVLQITRGNAVKAVQPLFETAVIGVDVLDMDGAVDAHTRTQIDRFVREVRVLRKAAVAASLSYIALSKQFSHREWPCPAATSQAFWLTRGVHLRAGVPGVDLDAQARIHPIANACADFIARRQTLAGLDGAIGVDGLARPDAPARFQVHAAADGPTGQDALPGPNAVSAADTRTTGAQALAALDPCVDDQVLADECAACQ